MRAIRFHELGEPDVLRLEEMPEPAVEAGEALIEVHAAGVNYADTRRRRGLYLEPTPLPYVPGSEVAGTIARLGEGVTGWRVGDRVMATVSSGGYAEYVTAPAQALLPIPQGLGFAEAAAFPVQGLTAYHLLRTSGRLAPGESVLVHSAAGGVGTLAIQLARLMGAGTVYATASTEEKLALVRSLGADVAINYASEDFAARVIEHARSQGGRGADIILEAVGGEVLENSLRCLAPFGRLVVFGRAGGMQSMVDPVRLMKRCQELIGFWLPPVLARPLLVAPSVRELSEYLTSGRLKVLVGATFSLEDAAEAHRRMEGRETTGKVVLAVRE